LSETARILSDRVGLGDRTEFLATAGESTPLNDGSFDAAVMVHVGMNLPDKPAVFAEVHRVLRPGGRFGLYEQVRTDEGDLPYPLPWAPGADPVAAGDGQDIPQAPSRLAWWRHTTLHTKFGRAAPLASSPPKSPGRPPQS
jgi:SAM-dependent methyltransferase